MNVGKIPLTNSELIKALFLNKTNFSSDEEIRLKQLQIASSWDEIEATLQNDEFWPYGFNYGVGTEMQFPWNMTFSTNITEQSRRGYSDASMNTNELIWGFQFSQRLLPKRNLTITVRANDVLNQRDNVNRNVSATARTDTRTLNVHSYYLLTVSYRFGKFGGGRGRRGDFGERGEGNHYGPDTERRGGPEGNEGPRGGFERGGFGPGGGPGGGF